MTSLAAAIEPATAPDPAHFVTVLYPCLNEEHAIGDCVKSAFDALKAAGLDGEVLVIDNASTDRSGEIAAAAGARVVVEKRRGYGSAYLRGFREARGEYVIMLDADGTYPVEMIGEFVRVLRDEGAEMVIGNRFAGRMERGAMPFMNRYIGNPILSGVTRSLFSVRLRDIHCGMRGFRRSAMSQVDLRMPGMEFATEMIVKALDGDLKTREVGIPYRPRLGESKLHPVRDAWRHLEYMLVFSPALLFMLPGALLAGLGLAIQLLLLSGPRPVFFRTWDVHTNLAGLAAALFGITLLSLGVIGSAYAWSIGMRFRHSAVSRLIATRGPPTVRLAGTLMVVSGLVWWLAIIGMWVASSFGTLAEVPHLSLATTMLTGGLELIGTAFIAHLIGLNR